MATGVGLSYGIKTYELIKYLNMANPFFGWSPVVINDKFYQSLSPNDRYLVKSAALTGMQAFQGIIFWGQGLYIEEFKKKGIEVYFPTSEELNEWVRTMRPPMIQWTKKQIGAEWVDKFIRASEQAEKKLYGAD